jgi:hypothetical protein
MLALQRVDALVRPSRILGAPRAVPDRREDTWGVELSIRGVDVDGMREEFVAPATPTEVRQLAEALLAIAETTA